jgi:hypothetical protein
MGDMTGAVGDGGEGRDQMCWDYIPQTAIGKGGVKSRADLFLTNRDWYPPFSHSWHSLE